jgi:light-regulated signal transduction histidine kinase (bacteriophytochrome)
LYQNNLQEAINKLEISNRELEQFAYVASHDLQEPLRMVSSFTQLLERRYKDKLDSDADEYIDFIVEGSHRMKDLIDDLLVFSRLNTDKKEFKLTDLNQLLENVLFNFESVIEDNKIQIAIDSLPIIKCDASQINQLFQNLISNAIKFRNDESPEIHIACQNSDNNWLFSVSDNGIGIDSEHQKKIFNVFSRLHTRDEYEGTGIGLSICKRIIERHGGEIWVESEPRQGSTFYFTITK